MPKFAPRIADAVRLNLQATGKDNLWSAFLDLPDPLAIYVYRHHRLAVLADEAVALPDLATITGYDPSIPF